MRHTIAALALLGTLALSGCATATPAATPTGTGTAVAAATDPTDLLDCSPILKQKLDPDLFDTSKCWTTPDAPEKTATSTTTHNGAVYMLAKTRRDAGMRVIARNASDGKKLWTSAALEDIANSTRPAEIVIHNFSANGTDAIAVGYPLDPQGYRVTIHDAKTGKELSKNDTPAAAKEVTWGSGAVAVKTFADEVSTLTLGGAGFKALPALPWDTKAPVDNFGKPEVGNHVIHATKDRLVLDMAGLGTPGPVITDTAGTKIGVLPAGTTRMVRVSFCDDFALVDRQDGTPASWFALADGKPVDKPGCKAGSYFPAGVSSEAFADHGNVGVSRIGNGAVSADGKTVIVDFAGIYSTTEATSIPLTQSLTLGGASNTAAYGPLSTVSLAGGEVKVHKDMTSLSTRGFLESGDSTVGLFSGDWGVGGAPVK
ncbi:hypothetical protein [Arthrobacter sp. ES1]|uniref:hypothetical protein n=1 Tax=Arthrobacter sp. ES1 TaxID=1897056 RepID=UPI001CFF6FD5|nr:hypothetical protein [Arthrobacter sp. ES1]